MPDDARKPAIDKAKLPSRHTTVGPERARIAPSITRWA